MFGISIPELAVILVIVLIFVGPKKLPEAAHKLGRLFGDLKRSSDGVRREFYNAIYAPAKEIRDEVKRELIAVRDPDPGETKTESGPATKDTSSAETESKNGKNDRDI